jgi:hypothetical protein
MKRENDYVVVKQEEYDKLYQLAQVLLFNAGVVIDLKAWLRGYK